MPTYYKIISQNWCLQLTSAPVLPSAIASQALWYNKNIKIDNKSIYLSEISEKSLNCVGNLFNERQKLKNDLSDKENIHDLIFQNHHLIRKHHIHFTNRLSSKEIYNVLIAQKEEQTSSRLYYQKSFNNSSLDWKSIYL